LNFFVTDLDKKKGFVSCSKGFISAKLYAITVTGNSATTNNIKHIFCFHDGQTTQILWFDKRVVGSVHLDYQQTSIKKVKQAIMPALLLLQFEY